MILRNILKYNKFIQGQTDIKVGDIIKHTMTFTNKQTVILQKMLNITKQGEKQKKPYPLQVGASFSNLIGNTLPESIYVKQDFQFKKPVQYGQQIDVQIEIMSIKQKKLQLKTQVIRKGQVLIDGKATIVYEKLKN